MDKKKKIVLVGTYYEQSHGDALLFDCLKYLYYTIGNKKNIQFDFVICDMFAKNKIDNTIKLSKHKHGSLHFIKKTFKSVVHSIVSSKSLRLLINREYIGQKHLREYYYSKFIGSDMIVIAGGGILKYSVRANFSPIFKDIIQTATDLNIPVIINAIGIEGRHNSKDNDFTTFKNVLNNPIVKMCTTRDRIDVLEEYYKDNEHANFMKISDTGVWASEAFSVQKAPNSKIIGLNVITPSRFTDYGKDITKQTLLSFWSQVIQILDDKQYEFRLFTHGLADDELFAREIIAFCDLDEDKLTPVPNNQFELVNNISNFKGIVANRLHACIVAYSLDIPAIGIAWNDKLLYWGKEIKYPNRFFDFDQLDPLKIVESLEEAIKEGHDQKHISLMKDSVFNSINESFSFMN
ncbi:polysaccharide pyruvyl transferase WcaK-like protein [Mangrovibacterium marinum]|uniref:Polysaccharide pyruvyl transferase WcaK-like protein n=1 Tax=Mangrovibacterium marinum TaxID=1639118 RepID=A0A2T5C6B0_9BACT|nr:polysaccharide pyruvyl transferase family protein [Mangrovibacterium marinum]PTN10484.1 polysaccharide pyruvyl transferase WcaK-like protein [Mangrovibacterium marinum]